MNIHEKRAIQSYGKIAESYDDSLEGRYTLPFNQKLVEIIQIPKNARLLDVACGNGRLLKMLQQNHTFEGYGADISKDMVNTASKALPHMVFSTAPCNALPFEDSFFDIVTVCTAFHHFVDVNAFAQEMTRILKPGASLYIAEMYYKPALRILLNPFIRFHPSGDVRIYSPKEITALLQKHGFTCKPALIQANMQIITAHKPA